MDSGFHATAKSGEAIQGEVYKWQGRGGILGIKGKWRKGLAHLRKFRGRLLSTNNQQSVK